MHTSSHIIVFDTETTGLSPRQGHRIIELGAIKIAGKEIVDQFHTLIDAGVQIDPRAQAVHGISRAMLRGQPRPHEVFAAFRRFIGPSRLVAHNAPFDMRFLRAEFTTLGFDLPNRVECTLQLSRKKLRLANYQLDTVYQALGGENDDKIQRHRALDDARMAAFVWLALRGM